VRPFDAKIDADIHRHRHGPPRVAELIRDYVADEQRLGRISGEVGVDAVTTPIMGAGQLMALSDVGH